MVDARCNPPGHNLDAAFWEDLKRSGSLEKVSFNKGEAIVPRHPSEEELIFIRQGLVACDVPKAGQASRRLLLSRGDKFQPVPARRQPGQPSYRALLKVSAYRLSKRRVDGDVWRRVGGPTGNLIALDTWILDAVRAFRGVPVLSRFPARQVLELVKLEGAAFVLPPEETGRSLDSPGWLFVAKGDAEDVSEGAQGDRSEGGEWRDCRGLLPEGTVHSGISRVKARDDSCVVVLLPNVGIDRFIRSSPGIRRALRASCATVTPRPTLPNFILVAGGGADAPLDNVTALVAESVAQDFDERVLIVHLTAGDDLDYERPQIGVIREVVLASEHFFYDHPDFADYDTVFLLPSAAIRIQATYERLAARAFEIHEEASRTLSPLTILLLAETPFADEPADLEPLKDCRRRRVVLLGGFQIDEDPSYPPQATRVRLNLEEIRRLEPVALDRLPAWMRASFGRIGRAITDRQVGVALSGGGAWTFAHLALLEAMHQEGIPIDMVSGASGGALVGAYYCARGLDGLELLRKAVVTLDVAALLSAVWSSRALAWPVDLDLESRRLRDLDVPLYPIVADLDAGCEFVPRRGSLKLAECVRASSTLVPFTSFTTLEGRRCADGVFVNNTGERILAEEGADLIVASDVIQTPGMAKSGGLLDLVYKIRRIRDAADGAYLLSQSADTRDAFMASCTFRPDQLPTTPMFFSLAQFNESVAREPAEKFVAQTVRPLWDRLRAP